MFSAELVLNMLEIRRQMPMLNLLDRAVLTRNLLHVYHVIRASEGLIAVAMLTAPRRLKAFLRAKLEEETDHALWLYTDLVSNGIDPGHIPVSAAALAGVQYYMIYHVSPVCLLGYMAALECFPTPMEHIEYLEKHHGKSLLRTVRYHAEHDDDHAGELLDFIDQLPPSDQYLVEQAAIQATHLLKGSIDQLISVGSENSRGTGPVVHSPGVIRGSV